MVGVGDVRRGDVFIVDLNPTHGSEIRKARPCAVISPDAMNQDCPTVIIAPLTSGEHPYPFRVPCRLRGRPGHVVLDQVRAVDRERLVRRVGRLGPAVSRRVQLLLVEMFAP